jgi:hypothetical protein
MEAPFDIASPVSVCDKCSRQIQLSTILDNRQAQIKTDMARAMNVVVLAANDQ